MMRSFTDLELDPGKPASTFADRAMGTFDLPAR
jgi:hypothetical protein